MIFSLRIHFFGNKYFNILATSDISRKHLILISLQTLASIKMIIKFLEPILWEINVEYIQTFNHYTQHTHTNFHLNLIFFPFRNPWKAEIRVRNGFFPNTNGWPKTILSEESISINNYTFFGSCIKGLSQNTRPSKSEWHHCCQLLVKSITHQTLWREYFKLQCGSKKEGLLIPHPLYMVNM